MTDREIVVAIAEKVMQWTVNRNQMSPSCCDMYEYQNENGLYRHNANGTRTYWNPLTSISDAFQVVEKMRERFGYAFQLDSVGFDGAEWRCQVGWGDDPISVRAESDTPARAICLACLDAIESEGK